MNNDTAACLNTHQTAYIGMYYFQYVIGSLHCSGEWSFSHLVHEACMVRKYQMIHNQVIPKARLHGISSCALQQYDLNGSATNMLHYHYQL